MSLKNWLIIALLITLVFASSFTAISGQIEHIEPVVEKPKTVEWQVRAYFADVPVMARIAECESEFRHLNSRGEILRGEKVRSDVGVMQINEYYHGKTAKALGIDLHKLHGNLIYARYLFRKEGTTPWLASSACWGKENHIAKK